MSTTRNARQSMSYPPESVSESPTPRGGVVRVLQITDTHLYADPGRKLLGLNTHESFVQVLDLARRTRWPADLVLATGDLVHDASPLGYRRLHGQFSALEIPVYCLAGNHDESRLLASALNDDKVWTVAFARHGPWAFVFLDSTLPGSEGGHLSLEELDRLEHGLASNRDRHIMVCLHHQPVPVGSAWIDTMALDNAETFFRLIERFPRVRAVVWGHVHQVFDAVRKGVRLLSSPSTCVQFRPLQKEFALDDVTPGFRWLELYPDGRIETGIERLAAYPAGLDLCAGGY